MEIKVSRAEELKDIEIPLYSTPLYGYIIYSKREKKLRYVEGELTITVNKVEPNELEKVVNMIIDKIQLKDSECRYVTSLLLENDDLIIIPVHVECVECNDC